MDVERREAKNCIPKKNQEYVLRVAFNVLGSYTYTSKYIEKITKEYNAKMPVGYRCLNTSYGYYKDDGTQYWLILLIVVIIYFICSILFESLRLPLVIISLIPVSFIGNFLTYYFSGVEFGTGGFASLVLLSGLTVNAGIYIINEYKQTLRTSKNKSSQRLVRIYVRAYNHKIMAVLLTILSTVLGLIPFFIDGKEEPFWFSFAVGSAGGLLFSVFAVVFVMPILMKLSDGKKISWYDLNHGKRVSRQTFRLTIPIFFTVTKKQGESKAVVFLNTTYCVNLWHETKEWLLWRTVHGAVASRRLVGIWRNTCGVKRRGSEENDKGKSSIDGERQ